RAVPLPAKVVFESEVGVADAGGGARTGASRVEDHQQRAFNAHLKSIKQTVVQFEVGGVLSQVREGGALEAIKFIAEFEMKPALRRDIRVVGIKRLLAEGGRRHNHQGDEECEDRSGVNSDARQG